MQDRIILCIKWGDLFSADYVNVLFRAVSANLKPGFRFICLTDQADGLEKGIITSQIPHIDLTPEQIRAPGVWRKIALFHPDVAALAPGARALFIDLDMIIFGPLDKTFDTLGEIVMLDTGHDWRDRDPVQPSTGVFAFTLGEQQRILKTFLTDPSGAMANFHNEQDFVAAHATEVSLWPTGYVSSFKRHLVHRYGLDLILPPRQPPAGPAIIAFHGDPRPTDLLRAGIWGRFPHLGRGPIKWVQDYWTDYGGMLPNSKENAF